MEQGVGWIALLSGLTGAVITAIFNYIVNIKIANRNRRIEQQKLAFLYFVKLSSIVAYENIVKYISTAFEKPVQKMIDVLGIDKAKIETSSAAFAFIAEALKLSIKDGGKGYESFKISINHLKTLSMDSFGYELPDQLLSQFPKEAIVEYEFIVSRLKGVRSILSTVCIAFNDKKPELINSQLIFLFWNSLEKIPQSAKNFRNYLVAEANLDKKFASEVTARHTIEIFEQIKLQIFRKEELERASKWLEGKIQPQTKPSDK